MEKMLMRLFLLTFLLFMPKDLFPQSGKSLDWQVQFIRERNRESMPISRSIMMETGERFRLIIKADNDCYCYVLVYDSEQNIYVWYNQAVKSGSGINLEPLKLSEPSGMETIYIVISFSRQGELERLITLYNNSPSRQNTENLYREIVRLQNAASDLGEPASAIVTSGGSFRDAVAPNSPDDEKEWATKFSGKDLYVRAIGIRH